MTCRSVKRVFLHSSSSIRRGWNCELTRHSNNEVHDRQKLAALQWPPKAVETASKEGKRAVVFGLFPQARATASPSVFRQPLNCLDPLHGLTTGFAPQSRGPAVGCQ